MSFLVLLIIILSSIFIIINKVGKPLMYEENDHLLEQYGNKIVALLSQETHMAECLTSTLANLGETLAPDDSTYKTILPHLINLEDHINLIAGGGIWPEAYSFNPGIERRSFFWGRDSLNNLVYFDNYNDPKGKGYHHEEWYVPLKYINTESLFWSKSYMDPYSFQPMVTCTAPMIKNGVFTGVATIDLRLEGLNRLLNDAIEKSGGYAYLFDRNNKLLSFPNENFAVNTTVDSTGNIIYDFLYARELAQKEPLFKPVADYLQKLNELILALAKSDSRYDPKISEKIAQESYQISAEEAHLITATMLDPLKVQAEITNSLNTFYIKDDIFLHEPVIVSVFHMPQTYWKIVIVTPYKKSVAIINHITQKLILLLSVVLIISLLAIFILFGAKILIPLRRLSLQLKNEANTTAENAALLDFKSKDEIGELVYRLNQRTTELKLSTIALKESEEKYRAIFENTGTASAIISEDTTLLLVNDKFVKKSGYLKEQIEGKMSWFDFVQSEYHEKLKLTHDLRRLESDNVQKSFETKYRNKEGEIFEVYINVEMLPGMKTSIASLIDITKRKKAETELIKAKERAEESDRLKTVFLQNISHEIRTPLNAISGFCNFLSDENIQKEQQELYVRFIQNNSDQLVTIVSDILTLSSLLTNQEEVHLSGVCIDDVLKDLYFMFKDRFLHQDIMFNMSSHLNGMKCEVDTDKSKLTQILVNLLSNALKYTEKGKVEFGYSVKDLLIEFYVKDTGIGIAPEYHKIIFERFGQALKDDSKIYRGAGLGLSISKGFVDLLGGKIWVESELGKGAVFYFTIPYKI